MILAQPKRSFFEMISCYNRVACEGLWSLGSATLTFERRI